MILYSPSHLRSKYHSTESRISLRSNITRRKANITEKAIAKSNCFFMVGEGGFEPPKPKQQIYSLPHLTALELSHILFSLRLEKNWSWWTDSNPRPADYKSAALPAELYQHLSNEQVVYYQTSIRLSTGNLKKGGILLYAGRRHHSPVHAVCSLCAQDIYAGETLWYRNGVTVCADCFPRFAREALRTFEYILGEASTL